MEGASTLPRSYSAGILQQHGTARGPTSQHDMDDPGACPIEEMHSNAEDVMYYFYLLIDSLHVFRFFYRSPADLAEKYPSIARQRTAILRSIQRQLTLLFTQLEKRALFSASATDRALLVELLSLVIFQSCQ